MRVTPLPIYVGISVHEKTRKRGLIDTLFDLGLSISYDRVMELSTAMANHVCEQYHRNKVVCPLNLLRGSFTTAAIHNIDHNPSSTSTTEYFHGTGISLFHHPSPSNHGIDRREYFIFERSSTNRWLNTVEHNYCQETSQQDGNISWAAYHANQQPTLLVEPPHTITAMLPLFYEDSRSFAIIRHSMDMIKKAVQELNPGLVPVITVDQPIYAISKLIQWNWPANYGEEKFDIILGGLHIEMAALKVLGDWLDDSGWIEALVEANVASAGTVESFLKASHVKRTRLAHEVTASSLHILLKKLYAHYVESLHQDYQPVSFEEWCNKCNQQSPHFKFWHTGNFLS